MISLKIKIAAVVGIVITIVVSVVMIYVGYLKNKVDSLTTIISEQERNINQLNTQIDSINKNVKALNETINITSEYIDNLERARLQEISIRDNIYNALDTDNDAKDWYDSQLPPTLLQVLIKNANNN